MDHLFASNDNFVDFWSGLAIDRLPKTKTDAAEVGCRFFYTGKACLHGHVAPRYTKGGRCAVCTQNDATLKRPGMRIGPNGSARAHLCRSIALLDGEKTYVPARPCKHGHSLRWSGTNNCVGCEEMRKDEYRQSRRETRLLKKYGITADDFEKMVSGQGSSCAICHVVIDDHSLFHVDHCHSTNLVRGLLCQKCNQALGLFMDDATVMRRAAIYVERFQERMAA